MKKHYLLFLSILITGLLPRTLHLFNDNYYILNPDSYLFHYLAQNPTRPVIEVTGYPWHSGLVYPIHYLGQITGVTFASCIIPLIIYIVSTVALYWFVSRYWNKVVAISSVILWSLIPQSCLITSAGYIDRDGLSLLLLMIAVIASKKKNISGAAIISVIALLQWGQWHLAGAAFTLFVTSTIILYRWRYPHLKLIHYILIIVAVYGLSTLAIEILNIDTTDIGECQHLRLADIFLGFGWAVPIIVAGVIVIIKYQLKEGEEILLWMVITMAGSVLVSRLIIFALPAACIIGGIAIDYGILKYRESGGGSTLQYWQSKVVAVILVITLVTTSIFSVLSLQTTSRMTANRDWQEALSYLKSNSVPGSKIACLSSFNYWVMDLGDRRPATGAAQRGKYNEVSILYCTDDINEYNGAISDLGADYFIYSAMEYDKPYWLDKLNAAADNTNYNYNDCYESLAMSCFGEDPKLNVEYKNESVVITRLSEPADQPAGGSE